MSSTIITLTTDFGVQDAYVGIMKGVMCSLAPGAQCIDLCHIIRPQDVVQGALTLWSAIDVFPEGTVHLAVVDPGVGSQRRAIAVEAAGHLFVGPDNGLLWPSIERLGGGRVYDLDDPKWFRETISATFHGRDIFSPVAGHLAAGVPIEELGTVIEDPVRLSLFQARKTEQGIEGCVLTADHFGNIVTDIKAADLKDWKAKKSLIQLGEHRIQGWHRTFSDVAPGEVVAYINSFGLLEVAVRNASAMEALQGSIGESVWVRKQE